MLLAPLNTFSWILENIVLNWSNFQQIKDCADGIDIKRIKWISVEENVQLKCEINISIGSMDVWCYCFYIFCQCSGENLLSQQVAYWIFGSVEHFSPEVCHPKFTIPLHTFLESKILALGLKWWSISETEILRVVHQSAFNVCVVEKYCSIAFNDINVRSSFYIKSLHLQNNNRYVVFFWKYRKQIWNSVWVCCWFFFNPA